MGAADTTRSTGGDPGSCLVHLLLRDWIRREPCGPSAQSYYSNLMMYNSFLCAVISICIGTRSVGGINPSATLLVSSHQSPSLALLPSPLPRRRRHRRRHRHRHRLWGGVVGPSGVKVLGGTAPVFSGCRRPAPSARRRILGAGGAAAYDGGTCLILAPRGRIANGRQCLSHGGVGHTRQSQCLRHEGSEGGGPGTHKAKAMSYLDH